jgi:hypothetical protein
MKKYLGALAGAVLLAGSVLYGVLDGPAPRGSSADRTAYSFVYAVAHHNFGRACSWYEEKYRGPAAECGASLSAYVGQIAAMFGVDVATGMHVVPGSKRENKDGSFTYGIASKEGGKSTIRVAQGDNGKWRVVG